MYRVKLNWIQALASVTFAVSVAAIVVQPNKNERVDTVVQPGVPPPIPPPGNPYPPNYRPNFAGALPPPSITVEVSEDSGEALYQLPGTSSWIYFDVTNWRDFQTLLYFMAADRMGFARDHRPRTAILPPGRTIKVGVLLVLPYSVGVGTADNVTLTVQGPDQIVTRSAAVTVGQQESDTWRPSCDYTITRSCKDALDTWKCEGMTWAAEATIQDEESGLLKVTAQPPIGFRYGSFYAGTKEEVKIYFQASCCEKIVEIRAVDLQGNYRQCKIDVTAGVLNAGEITAVVLGVLLLIAIIAIIIAVIVICRRRRRQQIKL